MNHELKKELNEATRDFLRAQIASKVNEKEAEEFFKIGRMGSSLFESIEDITQYDHVTTIEEYIEALIENMRGSVELAKQEEEDRINAQLEIDARDDKA